MDFVLTLDWALILLGVALVAGFVDSIAGGGGLLTIPALMSVGLSPAQALATNKLQACAGSFSASVYFIRKGMVKLKDLDFAIFMTFVGSALGTVLVQMIDAGVLAQLIPFLMLAIAAYFLFAPGAKDGEGSKAKMSMTLFACTAGIGVGFYDGFFGPGTGSFFAIAFVSLMGFTLTKATAHTKILNFTSNISSLLFFIAGGQVVWMVGGVMIIGQFIGAQLGSKVVMNKGQKIIRPMIVTISLVMTGKLLWEQYAYLLSF